MPVIHLETVIHAPRERVFDLARSIDAHVASTPGTNERPIAGATSGLLDLGRDVTWEARHLGVKQRLRVKMTALERPHYFRDEMLAGAFRSMRHDHHFETVPATISTFSGATAPIAAAAEVNATLMRDRFEFRSPLGPLDWLVDRVFLTRYLHRLLEQRNAILKRTAETDAWRSFLPCEPRPHDGRVDPSKK